MTRASLVLLGLLLVSPDLAAASSFGPETPLTPPVVKPSITFQRFMAVAPNGDGFLAAWHDDRGRSGIYATHLDRDGRAVDQPSFFVGPQQGQFALAPSGRDTLLAAGSCNAIDVMRIGEGKEVTASSHVNADVGTCTNPLSLATNGETTVVVWEGIAVVLDADLHELRRFQIDLMAFYSAVATNGRDYIVLTARTQTSAAKATHLDHAGMLVSTGDVSFPNAIQSVDIASNGDDYLALAGGSAIGALHLDANGQQVGTRKTVPVAGKTAARLQIEPNGDGYIAAYLTQPVLSQGQQGSLVQLDRDGNLLAERKMGTRSDLVMAVRPEGGVDISGARAEAFAVDTLAQRSDAQPIAYATPEQYTPHLVDAGGALTAFWRERSIDAQTLKARRLPDGAETTLITNLFNNYTAAFDGEHFVVEWQSLNNSINVQRFNVDLTPIDPLPLTVSAALDIFSASMAAGGGRALITWVQGGAILAEVIDTTAEKLTTVQPITLSVPPHGNRGLSAAWNGSEFVVVWAHDTAEPVQVGLNTVPPPDQVVVRRVSIDGTSPDAAPVVVADPKAPVFTAAVASNGSDFFAIWTADAIKGKFIGATLTMPGGDGVVIGPAGDLPEVAPYRGGYVVAWGAPGAFFLNFAPTLRLVDAGGNPGPAFSLPELPKVDLFGNRVTFASGMMLYGRAATEPEFGGVARLFLRTFQPVQRRSRAARH